MEDLNTIVDFTRPPEEVIAALKEKTVIVPPWRILEKEYDPRLHPVMNKAVYPDIVDKDGKVDYVTRIATDMQRLAAHRMTDLMFGIPVKRIYLSNNEKQKEFANWMEAIYASNRIDSVNIERGNMLFAGCEVFTIWYSVATPTDVYGFKSPVKIRCKNYSPMLGHSLYPLFDEDGDMIAMSVEYKVRLSKKTLYYFDTYTAEKHIRWVKDQGAWVEDVNEDISAIGKIPGVYCFRRTPIWENSSSIVYESEWALSRTGNYIRKNSKPIFVVFADEVIRYGDEQDEKSEFKGVLQYPRDGRAEYVTWEQATDTLKFYLDRLESTFFGQLQIPNWSYEKMSQQALSGESRKQMFIDAMLKVKSESGRVLDMLVRESNVIKAFMKQIVPSNYASELDSLR